MAQLLMPILVLLINGKRKNDDVKADIVDREVAAMDNEAWSKPVILTSKNLANQFQFPVVFYVLCLMLSSLDAVTAFGMFLAWAFVATRAAHTLVHINSNNVKIRMPVFVLGVVILIVLFVHTGLALFAHSAG
jgi:hypothetical protein